MAPSPSTRTKVFISYSHADKEWLDRLKRHLKPLVREGNLDCWNDTHIRPGDDWQQEIRTALDTAQVAVLLISANFFASDFIDENELPPLLAAAEAKGVRILSVIISVSRFVQYPDLARFQAVNPPVRPLNEMPPAEQETVLDRLAHTIESIFDPHPPPPPNTPPGGPSDVSDPNRRRMLKVVRETWIDGYLKHSLDNLVRIELGLEEKPDAISRPWDAIVQQPGRAPRPLPPDQAMGDIFDELGQALLILGAPGAGKTTLLLELTRDLLDRAEQDANYPMPVVFHLSSWAVWRRPLADWLVDELAERYFVPRKVAQAWTDAEQVLPLLDGLDEVAPEHRAECVEAINTFHRQHGLVPLAVCCRVADYQALPARVALSGAIAINALSRAQVSTYLEEAGEPLDGLRTALQDDETLWELLDTPLMLSIVALAYRGRSAVEVRATGSLEERRAHLFANYSKRMFKRPLRSPPSTEYTREQTIRWVAWLAQSLMHNNLSVFYVEWMQPD